jgi:hypothetical protein
MSLSRSLAALGLAAAFALPGQASADEWPVAVLTIQTLDAFEQADSFSAALRLAVEDVDGWRAAQLEKDYALLVLVNTLGCTDPPDAACEQKMAAELKVDRLVWGSMKLEGTEVVGDLHLWQANQPGRSVPFRYPANLKTSGDDTLVAIAAKTFLDLVGGPTLGTVVVKANVPSGTVLVDGVEVGKIEEGRATVQVPPGKRKISVQAPGYTDMEAVIDVTARESREVALSANVATASLDAKIPLGFVSLGLGLGAAAGATWAGISAIQLNDDTARRNELFLPGEETNGCDGNNTGKRPSADPAAVDEFCSEKSLSETLQVALWPTAGVLGGLGVVLLAVSDWGGDAQESVATLPFIVLPSVSSNGVFVSVQGSLD